MAEEINNNEEVKIQPQHNLDAKWDACLDLGVRRIAYSSFSGALAGVLLFRSPATRWVSVALGVGIGIGSSYTECSRIFSESTAKLTTDLPETSDSKVQD